MPSVDKAILNPFEPLSITEALLVAVCGLVVVFMMLAMLMVVIYVISWVVQQIDSKRKPTPVPAKKTAAAPAPKPAPAPAPAQTDRMRQKPETHLAEAAERQAAAEGHTEEQEAGEGSPAFTMSM